MKLCLNVGKLLLAGLVVLSAGALSGDLATLFGAPAGTEQAIQPEKPTKTDAEIRREIIRASISNYSGSCPCPYNTDRAGRSCGRRSAYSRPGGASPLCYESDVTQNMVNDYRKRTKQEVK
jgi:hypothetical protein